MSSTRPSLLRLVRIHQAIAEKHYPSVAWLAEETGVHPRTIKRDLKALREELGAPLIFDADHRGYGYTQEFHLHAPPLTEGEMLALCMMATLSECCRDTPFAPAIQRALRKLRLLLPEPVQAALEQEGPFVSRLPDPAPPEQVDTVIRFNDLLHAIETHRQVRLVYYAMSRDLVSTRVVDPYHLHYARGMWYLHGWCHTRHETRDFALPRIRALEMLSVTFPAPDMAAIRARLAERFTVVQEPAAEVVIHFDAECARRIRERVWHPSQRIADHPDGACTLTMTVAGLSSVTRWVLGYGRHATPLAPPELVRAVAEEVRAMVQQLPGA